ncbi:MAG: hypothetical protein ACTSUC_09980 [Promethearchaeota archaeon]
MNEIIIKVANIKKDNINEFYTKINDKNAYISREKLKIEIKKIINILKDLKKKGIISTIYYPKNKKCQESLDKLVNLKRQLKKSLEKINVVFLDRKIYK